MPRKPTTPTTVADTLELTFEQLIRDTIMADSDYQSVVKPPGWAVYCMHETDTGKPPGAVIGVQRRQCVFPDDGLWECGVGVELRLSPNDEGMSEALFGALSRSLERDALIAALNTDATSCPTGGIVYDQEFPREIEDEHISRMFTLSAWLGLIEVTDADGGLGVGGGNVLGVGGGNSIGVAA